MAENWRVYGEWFSGTGIAAVRADHILGSRIELDAQRRPDQVAIQFAAIAGVGEVQMDFAQAMFLLSTLKSIQLDTGLPFPDDPRADRNNPLC